jgi:hypothetical protein
MRRALHASSSTSAAAVRATATTTNKIRIESIYSSERDVAIDTR